MKAPDGNARTDAKPINVSKKTKRRRRRAPVFLIVLMALSFGLLVTGIVIFVRTTQSKKSDAPPCAAGFTRIGPRCCPSPEGGPSIDTCAMIAPRCAPPLVMTARGGCDAPNDATTHITVPPAPLAIGPSDWEAEGRVAPRVVRAGIFSIDRYEVSVGHFRESVLVQNNRARWHMCTSSDSARAAFGVPLADARHYCSEHGGHLPSEDEWLVAAAGGKEGNWNVVDDKPRRYPWGDTGAVCRRAAFGLDNGPCAEGARGPDTVGSHPDGATPLGIQDLAGNVAEWVETPLCPVTQDWKVPCVAVVRGGSWKTTLATELRTWLRREVPSDVEDPTIGFRCARTVVF